ncbi:transcriptional regulator with XRE-family HTH domain [Nocardia transvalensis]|uniref:Transcriptional regulator with XRE-family HTH domain n=1 Tax=Nocardia transvalensis TaxID=37333 RepID=A0A7W9P9Z3_9NOCA|nr:XRE family transcriptional regulator [Nocardia transvalensis]MBB5912236.1 transcriptional regulator with XRE-family HTH domain [Nocardia transvalensis]
MHANSEVPRRLGLADVVHNRRLAAKLTLAQLAQRTALSPSFLSQFENGHTNSSLRSLQRIAGALGTTATALLAEANPAPSEAVVRAEPNPLPAQDLPDEGSRRSLVHGRRDLRALEYTGGTARADHDSTRDSDELIYVVRGTITVLAGGAETELSTGDSYYCTAGESHSWWAHTDETVTLLLSVADGLVVRRPPHRPR